MNTFYDPVAPWLERPSLDVDFLHKLPEDIQVLSKRFRDKGYLIHDFGFSEALIEDCRCITRALHGKVKRQQDLWRHHRVVKELATHPRVIALLSSLYDRNAFPFQTLNFPVGTEQATHSDSYYFSSVPERYMCGVWVALEDIDLENGPLHYYPYSHKLPVYSRAQVIESGANSYDDFVNDRLAEAGAQKNVGLIRKGEAIIWSANLFHGGEVVRDTSRSRLSQVTHYYFDDCVYFTPANSFPEKGSMHIRMPYDFSRNRFVLSSQNGEVIRPTLKVWMAEQYFRAVRYSPSA